MNFFILQIFSQQINCIIKQIQINVYIKVEEPIVFKDTF